jgi:hypothetical protein
MTENVRLIARQLSHLQRMHDYLMHSVNRCKQILPVSNWQTLSYEEHEMLAAFRVRFSEFQEHLGKTMRAVAIEENVDVDRFGSVLAFMEKMRILESAERWKLIREIRNAINHEYEEDALRLSMFFAAMIEAAPELFSSHAKLVAFCKDVYKIVPEGLA